MSFLRRLSGHSPRLWGGHRKALPCENVTRELGAHKRSGSMQPPGHRFYTTMPWFILARMQIAPQHAACREVV